MTQDLVRTERERDLDRLLTFVDAIAAIAITLLVLPLVELSSELEQYDSVGELLRDHSDPLWTFGLSFYVIARFWLIQHRIVSPLLVGNRRITWLLVVWTFTIVVLPFPTSLVAGAGDEALTKVLYVGTMILSVLIHTGLRIEIRRHPELTDGSPAASPVGGLLTAGVLAVALAIMLAVPATSFFPILLLALEPGIERLLGARNRSAP